MVKARDRGYITDETSKDFLMRMICVREKRLDADQCRNHPFFAHLDFTHIHELQPPIVPAVSASDDTRHFDEFEYRPVPPTQHGAKDAPMQWMHYDFDRQEKHLHSAHEDLNT